MLRRARINDSGLPKLKSIVLLFNSVYVPFFLNGVGCKKFDHFGAIFYNNLLKNLPFVNLFLKKILLLI